MNTALKYNRLKLIYMNLMIFDIFNYKDDAKGFPGLPFYPQEGRSKFWYAIMTVREASFHPKFWSNIPREVALLISASASRLADQYFNTPLEMLIASFHPKFQLAILRELGFLIILNTCA